MLHVRCVVSRILSWTGEPPRGKSNAAGVLGQDGRGRREAEGGEEESAAAAGMAVGGAPHVRWCARAAINSCAGYVGETETTASLCVTPGHSDRLKVISGDVAPAEARAV